MRPSEKKRMQAMRLTDLNLIRKMWFGVGAIILIVCILLGLFIFGLSIDALLFIGMGAVFAAVFVGIALAVIYAIAEKISDGLFPREPVIENRISPEDLLSEALKINEMDVPWMVEAHEGKNWVDVTWRWKDSIDYQASLGGNAIDRNLEVFYKYFKVYDDFTYDDVDMKTSLSCRAGVSSLSLDSSMQMGRLRTKAFTVALGTKAGEGTGFHEYTIDSDMLANFMHNWFAEHGYRYRGF